MKLSLEYEQQRYSSDFTVTTATGTTSITITVSAVGRVTLGARVVGTFAGAVDP